MEKSVDYVYKIRGNREQPNEIREMTNGRIRCNFWSRTRKSPVPRGQIRDMFTDRTRQLIARRFEKDIDTFRYVF